MTQETGLGSKQDRKAIASTIQRHLDANGLARKDLIREHLSKSSIEKLFQGDFTERTLNKVEGILKTSFQRQAQGQPKARDDTAAKSVGGYVFDASNICKATISASARCLPPLRTSTPI
jgi:hypothetical protein